MHEIKKDADCNYSIITSKEIWR